MLRHVHLAGDNRAMQSLVKQQVRSRLQILPRRKRAGRAAKGGFLFEIVHIMAGLACPGLAESAECILQLAEQVRFRAEMA